MLEALITLILIAAGAAVGCVCLAKLLLFITEE